MREKGTHIAKLALKCAFSPHTSVPNSLKNILWPSPFITGPAFFNIFCLEEKAPRLTEETVSCC
jgi:hypothetical protein